MLADCWLALTFELVAGATHSCTRWVAALDHEVVDYTVENDSVVESARSKIEETSACDRCVSGEKCDVDVALVGGDCDVDI